MIHIRKILVLASLFLLPVRGFSILESSLKSDPFGKGGWDAYKLAMEGATKKSKEAVDTAEEAKKTEDPEKKKELEDKAKKDALEAKAMKDAGDACKKTASTVTDDDSKKKGSSKFPPMLPSSPSPKKEDKKKEEAKTDTKAPDENKGAVQIPKDPNADALKAATEKPQNDLLSQLGALKPQAKSEPVRAAEKTAEPVVQDNSVAVVQANALPVRPQSFAEPVDHPSQVVTNADRLQAASVTHRPAAH